ncbi:hypothetical protein ScPMuIL_016803 [Solemya velum]
MTTIVGHYDISVAVNRSENSSFLEESNVTTMDGRNEGLAKIEVGILALIFSFAVFGNMCVLIALYRSKKKENRMYIFIMHLSIADLMVAVFNVLPQLIWDITHRWYGGDFVCRFIKYMQVFVMYLSTYILVMTAIDRYRAICHPLSNHTWTPKVVYLMVGIAYAVSTIFSIPQLILFKYQETEDGSGTYDCWVHFNPPWTLQLYITSFTFFVYIVPFLVLLFAYGSICIRIWQKYNVSKKETFIMTSLRKDCEVEIRQNSSPNSHSRLQNGTVHPRSHSFRGFSKAKLKTIKLTLVIILAYIICWSPFFISQLWWLYDEKASSNDAVVIMLLLSSLNSCCNPWIYLAFSGHLIRNLIVCDSHRMPNSQSSRSRMILDPPCQRHSQNSKPDVHFKRMESFSSTMSSRITSIRKESPITLTRFNETRDEKRVDGNQSPHLFKRARVHERPAQEIANAQKTWDLNMSDIPTTLHHRPDIGNGDVIGNSSVESLIKSK